MKSQNSDLFDMLVASMAQQSVDSLGIEGIAVSTADMKKALLDTFSKLASGQLQLPMV